MKQTDLTSLADLISEREVYERFPIFVEHELRQARQNGQVEFFDLRKGIFYTELQLIAYLEQRRRNPWQNKPLLAQESSPADSGNSKTNGSHAKRVRLVSTDIGTTTEQEALVAKALEPAT